MRPAGLGIEGETPEVVTNGNLFAPQYTVHPYTGLAMAFYPPANAISGPLERRWGGPPVLLPWTPYSYPSPGATPAGSRPQPVPGAQPPAASYGHSRGRGVMSRAHAAGPALGVPVQVMG